MFKKSAIIAFVLLVANLACANPAPLGLEIGKATVDDVKKNHGIMESKQNATPGYHNYFLDVQSMPFESVSKVIVICDAEGIVSAVYMYMDKKQFDDVIQTLSAKYTVVRNGIDQSGDKGVVLKDGDCDIKAYAMHDKRDMLLFYHNEKFNKDSDLRINAENKAKRLKAKSML